MRKKYIQMAAIALLASSLTIQTVPALAADTTFHSIAETAENKQKIADGVYKVGVNLWNAISDKESMGNNALSQTAKLIVKNGKGELCLTLKPMQFSGMTGYLSQLNLMTDIKWNEKGYPETYTKKPATVVSTYDVIDEFNSPDSKDSSCKGKKYPKELSIPVELGEDYVWVHVYVPIMGSMGFGNQEARVKIDYSSLKKAELKVASTKITLKKGSSAQIKVTEQPEAKVIYSSSNKKIAVVNKSGVVKAKKKGKVKIVVKSGIEKKTIQVTVQ